MDGFNIRALAFYRFILPNNRTMRWSEQHGSEQHGSEQQGISIRVFAGSDKFHSIFPDVRGVQAP
jgi:hypothetical protein